MSNHETIHGTGIDAAKVEATSQTIPLVREELDVSKRIVETGLVRIRKIVREHEEVIEQPLLREEVEITRLSIDRVIEHPVAARYEGEVLIVPVQEERLLIQKQWILKEELHISKRLVEAASRQRVVLRSEEAIVEREHPKGADV
jgi:uncharacterized protein (TIGR02271 family)